MSGSTPITDGVSIARAMAAGTNARDVPMLQSLLAPGSDFTMLPRSLRVPTMSGHDAMAMLGRLQDKVPDFHLEIKDIVEAKDSSKVWIYCYANGTAVDGRKYANEYVFMFDLVRDVDGALKISSMREFGDSAFTMNWMKGSAAGEAASSAK